MSSFIVVHKILRKGYTVNSCIIQKSLLKQLINSLRIFKKTLPFWFHSYDLVFHNKLATLSYVTEQKMAALSDPLTLPVT